MKVLKAISILELTQQNGFVEVFEVETEEIPCEQEERISESLEMVTKAIMKNDSFYMQTDKGAFVIRGLSKKTIKLILVWGEKEEQ